MKSWKGNATILGLALVVGASYAYCDPVYGTSDWASLLGAGIGGVIFLGLPIIGGIALVRRVKNSAEKIDRVQRSCNKSTDRCDPNR
jgi:hypothetical protein